MTQHRGLCKAGPGLGVAGVAWQAWRGVGVVWARRSRYRVLRRIISLMSTPSPMRTLLAHKGLMTIGRGVCAVIVASIGA